MCITVRCALPRTPNQGIHRCRCRIGIRNLQTFVVLRRLRSMPNQLDWGTNSMTCPLHHFRGDGQVVRMILPQVHLRKPCYDFSFL